MVDGNKVTVSMHAFMLPNFLTAPVFGKEAKFDVGELSDDDAAAYWDWMKERWLAHVKARRGNMESV
jgi:hypothetical protein